MSVTKAPYDVGCGDKESSRSSRSKLRPGASAIARLPSILPQIMTTQQIHLRGHHSYRRRGLAIRTMGRLRSVVTLRDFSVEATCYAELNGRDRPGAEVHRQYFLRILEGKA
jgi:hypothetical protein